MSDVLDVMPAMLTKHDTSPLDAHDRCDKCGAQAYGAATFESGILLFCRHHLNKYLDALCQQAESIDDFTKALEETGMTSANI